ncbi:DNA-binding protein [Deinococcus sp. HMF7620]|uniref:DNA-binding protein n=1 Tax=Deinococcus arboris TaxID=2682977 RepID=A0A7C9LR86_9DEIO|nr:MULTISPECIES: DNA-binding protein [Deinococcus]MBZ9750394.1 DNA-binding protein [Deinococcus betulae]MVN85380.1 DNA-binding protein [Deinococcus arboris]
MAKTKVDLTIPKGVQANAQRGLELRREHGYGGTKVGEATAHLLAAGGAVTARKARHISRYFPRHAGDNLDETGKSGKPSRGYIAWLLWGGDAGRTWSEKVVGQLDRAETGASAQSA